MCVLRSADLSTRRIINLEGKSGNQVIIDININIFKKEKKLFINF